MTRISNEYSAGELLDLDVVSQDFTFALINNLNDVEHLRFSRHRLTQHTLESTKAFVQNLRAMGGRYFQIIHVKSGVTVGTFTIKPIDQNQCEAGILVFREFSNQHIANTVWQFLPGFVAGLGFKFLVSGTHIQNIPMRRVMEKARMELDATRNYPNDKDASSENIYFVLQVQ